MIRALLPYVWAAIGGLAIGRGHRMLRDRWSYTRRMWGVALMTTGVLMVVRGLVSIIGEAW